MISSKNEKGMSFVELRSLDVPAAADTVLHGDPLLPVLRSPLVERSDALPERPVVAVRFGLASWFSDRFVPILKQLPHLTESELRLQTGTRSQPTARPSMWTRITALS